jgi:hypothetical protein
MDNSYYFYLLINSIVQTIIELEYDRLECEDSYNMYYYDTINNLLNILQADTRIIVSRELSKHSSEFYYN